LKKKKNLRLLAQPVMHYLFNFFIRPELASNSSSFRAPNENPKVQGLLSMVDEGDTQNGGL